MRNYKFSKSNFNDDYYFTDKIGIIGNLYYSDYVVKTYYTNSRAYGIKLFIKNKKDK